MPLASFASWCACCCCTGARATCAAGRWCCTRFTRTWRMSAALCCSRSTQVRRVHVCMCACAGACVHVRVPLPVQRSARLCWFEAPAFFLCAVLVIVSGSLVRWFSGAPPEMLRGPQALLLLLPRSPLLAAATADITTALLLPTGFSAQSVFFPLYIATFNAVWAAYPTLGYGLFEQVGGWGLTPLLMCIWLSPEHLMTCDCRHPGLQALGWLLVHPVFGAAVPY